MPLAERRLFRTSSTRHASAPVEVLCAVFQEGCSMKRIGMSQLCFVLVAALYTRGVWRRRNNE